MMQQQQDRTRNTVMSTSALLWKHPQAGAYVADTVDDTGYLYLLFRENSHKWAVGACPLGLDNPAKQPWPVLGYVPTARDGRAACQRHHSEQLMG